MTEIMPVPQNSVFTVLRAPSFRRAGFCVLLGLMRRADSQGDQPPWHTDLYERPFLDPHTAVRAAAVRKRLLGAGRGCLALSGIRRLRRAGRSRIGRGQAGSDILYSP